MRTQRRRRFARRAALCFLLATTVARRHAHDCGVSSFPLTPVVHQQQQPVSAAAFSSRKRSTMRNGFTPHRHNTRFQHHLQHRSSAATRTRQQQKSASSSSSSSQLGMALLPLAVDELERLISSSGKPTGAQYATYWGRTAKERYGRLVESATVSFLGVFFSYFLSFVLGGFVATILGCLFFFWGVLSPELKAYQRNWEFLGGRPLVDMESVAAEGADPETAGLYGGLFLGRVADVCVVEDALDAVEYDLADFWDYTMETDELDRYTGQPYLLRLQCVDRKGRTLQIHCRLSEEYLDLRPGRPATTLVLSASPGFAKLAALTDVYVLPPPVDDDGCGDLENDEDGGGDDDDDIGVWIGDYPYLDRAELEALLAEDDDLWDALQLEAEAIEEGGEGYYDSSFGERESVRYDAEEAEREDNSHGDGMKNDDDYDSSVDDDADAYVPARRRRRNFR